jgi:transposase
LLWERAGVLLLPDSHIQTAPSSIIDVRGSVKNELRLERPDKNTSSTLTGDRLPKEDKEHIMELSIGIDWADQSHAICLRERGTRRIIAEFEITHTAAGVNRLEETIQALGCTPERCVVAIETNQGMLVNYLFESGYRVHPIPPAAVKAYRDRHRRTGAKSDADDAQLLSDILCQDLELFPPLAGDSPLAREIRTVHRGREQLVRRRAQVLCQLKHNLKTYFPAAITLFSGLERQIVRAFLSASPDQRAAQQATRAEVIAFLQRQDYRRLDCVDEIMAKLHAPVIPVPAWQTRAGVCLTTALLAEIEVLSEQIQKLETQLERLLEQHVDAELFRSLPRVGTVLAAGLIGELGDCREKFEDASALQALAGTAPVTKQSGSSKQVFFRYACNKPLRCLLQQFARQSARKDGSSWARGYLSSQLDRGHSNSRAYRALANRWLVIIFRMWQDHRLYDENYHLSNIARRGIKQPGRIEKQAA